MHSRPLGALRDRKQVTGLKVKEWGTCSVGVRLSLVRPRLGDSGQGVTSERPIIIIITIVIVKAIHNLIINNTPNCYNFWKIILLKNLNIFFSVYKVPLWILECLSVFCTRIYSLLLQYL